MKKTINPISLTATAKEISKIGKIVYDIFDEGLRFIIMRGPCSWCAYIGIPENHPLAGFSYDDLAGVDAHGGLTFSGTGKTWPKGYYWYGWDYVHLGDYTYFEHRPESKEKGDKDWTIKEVIDDSSNTLYQFRKLMKLIEKIKNKNL